MSHEIDCEIIDDMVRELFSEHNYDIENRTRILKKLLNTKSELIKANAFDRISKEILTLIKHSNLILE